MPSPISRTCCCTFNTQQHIMLIRAREDRLLKLSSAWGISGETEALTSSLGSWLFDESKSLLEEPH